QEADGFEAKRRRKHPGPGMPGSAGPTDPGRRSGYAPNFLGSGQNVELPGLSATLADKAVEVNRQASGIDRFVLPYTHYSVVMNRARRMPFYSAVNIDGTVLRRLPRGNNWFLDSRISADFQTGPEVYKNNDLDK